jgi:hypothetical protein
LKTLQHEKFPIKIAFGMTIDMALDRRLNMLKYIQHRLVFSHGQLYVAFSRVSSFVNVTVAIIEGHPHNV